MPNVPRRRISEDSGPVDASDVTYAPIDLTDWDNDQDPGNVDDALDELADRTATNEDLLNELLPAEAPALSNMSTDDVGVSARLSFGPTASSNPPGYTNHPTLDVGDLFNTTSPNRGVISDSRDLEGTLADSVTADSSGSYPADAFGPGNEGTLALVVNGSTVHSVDLSSFGSGASVNANLSGFTLSASTAVQFPSGSPFSGRQYRTGTWIVKAADLRNGYNTVQVTHTTSGTSSTEEYVYIVDDDSTATVINDLAWSGLSTSGSKYLSGVEYHTDASADLTADIANAYRKTYSNGNAISYPNPNNCSLSSQALPNPGADGYTDFLDDISQSASLNATRIITGLTTYDGFRARVRCTRPLLATITSSYLEGFKLLIDRQSATSGNLSNDFNDEDYRIPSNANFDNNLSSTWDETISLVSATIGYSDGLQTINGGLSYPTLDFSTSTVTDGPAGNPDYSSASGTRYYYGYFTNGTGSANFRLTLNGSGVQVIPEATAFSGADEIKISIKLPQGAGSGTGWLDITQPFVEPNFNDGDGCYAATFGNDQTIPSTNWGLSVGTRNTANSYDKVYYRITAPSTFTGSLTEISIEWAVV
tara:strand:+ start:5370 stop:7148 length:1779 start_codon:yes stop_codon:yes gene_type:complete